MNWNMPKPSSIEKHAESSIICAKCRHSNPRRVSSCEQCGAHLYIACVDCGKHTPRSASRCSACGRRLHRRFLARFRFKLFGRKIKITPWQILLCLIAIASVLAVIVLINTMTLPEL
jgi:hypothetical protein